MFFSLSDGIPWHSPACICSQIGASIRESIFCRLRVCQLAAISFWTVFYSLCRPFLFRKGPPSLCEPQTPLNRTTCSQRTARKWFCEEAFYPLCVPAHENRMSRLDLIHHPYHYCYFFFLYRLDSSWFSGYDLSLSCWLIRTPCRPQDILLGTRLAALLDCETDNDLRWRRRIDKEPP